MTQNGQKSFLTFLNKRLLSLSGSELFMDAVSCLFLSIGALLALLAPTAWTGGFFLYFLTVSISLLLILQFRRKWWLAPIFFAGIFLFYFAFHFFRGNLGRQLSYWGDFIEWLLYGVSFGEGNMETGFWAIWFVVLVFLVTAILFVLIHKFFWFPLLFVLQTSVLFLSFLLEGGDLSLGVTVSAAGLILLLPRVYAKKLLKQNQSLGKTENHGIISRARMQSVALPAVILAMLLALWITPQQPWQSRLLNTWIGDISLLIQGPFGSTTSFISSDFNLTRMGMPSSTYAGLIGGPVTLSDRHYLSVDAEEAFLLKGKVWDFYDGRGWSLSENDGDLRLGSLFWRDYRAQAFDEEKPFGTEEVKRLYEQLTKRTKLHIYSVAPTFTTLFSPENMRNIQAETHGSKESPEIFFNRRSELYLHEHAINLNYTIYAQVWNRSMENFDDLFIQLEDQVEDNKFYPDIKERYTQLPEGLPASVVEKAEELTKHIDSPYLKAIAISRWLGENANYTLSPNYPPYEGDFVEHFLDTMEGYCVYYATAMTILSRAVGLPARYVEGFALEDTEYPERFLATGQTAHAWTEIYFEGIGWMPMDPLEWNAATPLNSNATAEEDPEKELETPTEEKIQEGQEESTVPLEEIQGVGIGIRSFLLALLLLASLFALVLWRGPHFEKSRWTQRILARRYKETEKQMDALYQDIRKLLSFFQLMVLPGETLMTFPRRVDKELVFNDVSFESIATLLMEIHFGNRPVTSEDIALMCLYHEKLESATLERLGKTKYLFRRVLR